MLQLKHEKCINSSKSWFQSNWKFDWDFNYFTKDSRWRTKTKKLVSTLNSSFLYLYLELKLVLLYCFTVFFCLAQFYHFLNTMFRSLLRELLLREAKWKTDNVFVSFLLDCIKSLVPFPKKSLYVASFTLYMLSAQKPSKLVMFKY